jgi:hypothetical protein
MTTDFEERLFESATEEWNGMDWMGRRECAREG